jgi:hypothetical protein
MIGDKTKTQGIAATTVKKYSRVEPTWSATFNLFILEKSLLLVTNVTKLSRRKINWIATRRCIPKRRSSNVQDVIRNLVERCVVTTAILLTEIIVFWANNIYLYDFKDNLNRHRKMHERRAAEREYTCNICGEVFRNMFPLQARQNAMYIRSAVGNVPRRQPGERKGKELMNQVCILLNENISITNFVLKQIFFLF